MITEKNREILNRLLNLTRAGKVPWVKESTDCYCAAVGGHEINVEFLYVEATNRPGADRQLVHIYFPGFGCYFAAGTEGHYLVVETLAAALEDWRSHIANYGHNALEFLDSLE